MLIYRVINNNGRVPTDRGLPAPDRSADAAPEDLSKQKRHRNFLQDAGDLSRRVYHEVLGHAPGTPLGLPLLQLHALHLRRDHCLHHLRHEVQTPLQDGTPTPTQSYDQDSDAFPHWALYLAALVLAFFFHRHFTLYGMLWSYSIWL